MKSKITTGDAVNSRSPIYVPKKLSVKKDLIYIRDCSRARINLLGEARPFASITMKISSFEKDISNNFSNALILPLDLPANSIATSAIQKCSRYV